MRATGIAIPEDLREHYEVCGKYQNAHLTLCRQLVERIAALTAERDELRAQVERLTDEAAAKPISLARLKFGIDSRLNDQLIEMKPGWDDSITGFNTAWDIVREVFKERLPATPPEKASGDLTPERSKATPST